MKLNSVLVLLIGITALLMIFQSHYLPAGPVDKPVLFVSRNIPCCGSVYMTGANALPGIGGFSKYQVAAPAYLCLLNPDKNIDTLLDGSKPMQNTFQLIDICCPSLSWDAKKIVFAGLPDGNYVLGNNNYLPNEHNAWRIYSIDIDGKNLQQITFSGPDPDFSQFSPLARGVLKGFDDTHPVWLPDGRICFSSTRFPGIGMYNVVRTSNLFVVNADGTDLHRITSEKNGADKPTVDPVTGKIVFARWWRNFYWPYDPLTQLASTRYPGGWIFKDGMTSNLDSVIDGETFMFNNNAFLLSEINPDGTEMKLFSAHYRDVSSNSTYGGSFDADGNFIGNWFPIEHISESSGFGGIKKYFRGTAQKPIGLAGITSYGNLDYYIKNPASYGIFNGEYAAEPSVTSSGEILFSKAPDPDQDYGIWMMDPNGNNEILIYDHPGTTELNAQLVEPKKLPPILVDKINQRPGPLPPSGIQNLRAEGTFEFDCRNIFYNGPVDDGILAAPSVGELTSVRFFAAPMQDKQFGSVEALDFPYLYNEIEIDPFNRVYEINAPANMPLFEQARSAHALGYKIPRTGGGIKDGAAHVTGFNYGRPGQKVSCVGCHAGHSRIHVPTDPIELFFTNLAPGARIKASSSMNNPGYLIDKKNYTASQHWFTPEGVSPTGQWLELKWLVPLYTKEIVLHNIPDTNRLRVRHCKVYLYEDPDFQKEIYSFDVQTSVSNKGSRLIPDSLLIIQSMRIEFLEVSGGIYHWNAASLGEIEVIASNVDPKKFKEICDCRGLAYGEHRIDSCGQCLKPDDPKWNDCLTQVEHGTKNELFTIYPQPASDKIIVETGPEVRLKNCGLRIYDLSGNLLFSKKISDSKTSLTLDHLSLGIYLLECYSDRKQQFQKLIKIE
ncbi:MAG: T9SS type A sorting domain-containing protein [Saprospiraceae bacterium]|nr:T9SS type A sorting domain-containing protein [Saprospiraceae bacterium]